MWIFIGLVLLAILGKFFYDMTQQSVALGKQGGMSQKYKELISYLLEGDEKARIIKETRDSILVGSASVGGSTIFNLVQTFGNLTIEWKMESPLFGKHKLEWTFPEYSDQKQMMEKLINDLGKYQKNIVSSSPFRDSFPEDED